MSVRNVGIGTAISLGDDAAENGASGTGSAALKRKIDVPESNRWYDFRTGRVVSSVKGANGKDVKPTIVHARKLALTPSVSSVTKILANNTLTSHAITEAVIALAGSPELDHYIRSWRSEAATKDEKDSIMSLILNSVQSKLDANRDEIVGIGKEIHAGLESLFRGGGCDYQQSVLAYEAITTEAAKRGCKVVFPEQSFINISVGIAGTMDVACLNPEKKECVVFDLKTTTLDRFKKPYQSWKLQGAAYVMYGAVLYNGVAYRPTSFANVVIDAHNPSEPVVCWLDEDELRSSSAIFAHIMMLWMAMNDYRPSEAVLHAMAVEGYDKAFFPSTPADDRIMFSFPSDDEDTAVFSSVKPGVTVDGIWR